MPASSSGHRPAKVTTGGGTLSPDMTPRLAPQAFLYRVLPRRLLLAFGLTNATKQIAANPKAELCAFKGMTLRIECKLIEDNRPETRRVGHSG